MSSLNTSAKTPPRTAAIVLILCWISVVLDGFDLVVLGALIPTLTGGELPWMSSAEATMVSTIGLIGMTLGALSIGIATDYLGRRQVMIWSVLGFSLATLACGLASSYIDLGLYRFIAGFGLGGCLPTAIAMVNEFSRGRSGTATTTVMTGYHVGAVSTALLALLLLEAYGWSSLFYAGAIPGLILAPVMMAYLPESPAFLLSKGRRVEAEAIAQNYGLALPEMKENAPQISAKALFKAPYLRNSLGIWAASFMGLILVYGLNTWLPKLMVSAGYELSGGLWLLFLLNIGAITGLVFAGRIGDRIGLKRAALLWFVVGGVLLALLSLRMPAVMLYPTVFITGCFVFSAQVLVYAYTAASHPPSVRASALGLSAGIGRIGAIMGPLIGGTLVTWGIAYPWGFYVFAAVGLSGAVAIASWRKLP